MLLIDFSGTRLIDNSIFKQMKENRPSLTLDSKYGEKAVVVLKFKTGKRNRPSADPHNSNVYNGFWINWTL